MIKMKILLLGCLELCMIFTLAFGFEANVACADGAAYADVPVTHWAYHEITALKGAGILDGYAGAQFVPSQAATRMEALELLMRLQNQSGLAPEQSADIPDQLKAKLGAVAQYYQQALASGVLTKEDFGKNMKWPIKRKEIAPWIAGMCNNPAAVGAVKRSFSDIAALNTRTKSAIEKNAASGIMMGNAKLQFVPEGYISRAELASIGYRLKSVLDASKAAQANPDVLPLGGRVISLPSDQSGKYIVVDSAPDKMEIISAQCKIRSSDAKNGMASINRGDQVILYRNTSGEIALIEKIADKSSGVLRSDFEFLKLIPGGFIALRNGQAEKLSFGANPIVLLDKKTIAEKDIPFGVYIMSFKFDSLGNIINLDLASRSAGYLMKLEGKVMGRQMAPSQFAIVLGYNTVITISETAGTLYQGASGSQMEMAQLVDGMRTIIAGTPDSNGYQIIWADKIQAQ